MRDGSSRFIVYTSDFSFKSLPCAVKGRENVAGESGAIAGSSSGREKEKKAREEGAGDVSTYLSRDD